MSAEGREENRTVAYYSQIAYCVLCNDSDDMMNETEDSFSNQIWYA